MESRVIFFSFYSLDFIGGASDSGDICKCSASAKDNSFIKSYYSNSKISNSIFLWKTVLRGLCLGIEIWLKLCPRYWSGFTKVFVLMRSTEHSKT